MRRKSIRQPPHDDIQQSPQQKVADEPTPPYLRLMETQPLGYPYHHRYRLHADNGTILSFLDVVRCMKRTNGLVESVKGRMG